MKKVGFVLSILILVLGCGPSETKENVATIPGIVAVDVHGNFTDIGFELTKDIKTTRSSWTVTDETTEHDFTVVIYGTPSEVFEIEATALNFSSKDTGEVTKAFLGYVATIPYDGSSPIEAKKWVESNINTSAETTFGSVELEIVANPDSPRARILMISPVDKD